VGEIEYILANRGKMTDEQIGLALSRSRKSVKQKMQHGGLWRTAEERSNISRMRWTGEGNPRWKNGISKTPEYQAIKKERYLFEIKARGKVHDAVKAGKIEKQPCEVCGSTVVEAHHEDYDKPLEVRWLCRAHHVEVHKQKEK
jgi:ribosomal protein S27AE